MSQPARGTSLWHPRRPPASSRGAARPTWARLPRGSSRGRTGRRTTGIAVLERPAPRVITPLERSPVTMGRSLGEGRCTGHPNWPRVRDRRGPVVMPGGRSPSEPPDVRAASRAQGIPTGPAGPQRSGEHLMADTVTITAEKRSEFGKGAARRIRRAKKIPAVLYGHGTDPVHVTLPGHDTMLAVKVANAVAHPDDRRQGAARARQGRPAGHPQAGHRAHRPRHRAAAARRSPSTLP